MTKREIKKLTNSIRFSANKWGILNIDLVKEAGYNLGVKINPIDLMHFALKKIKKGEFTISEQPKGNKHARIIFN